MNYETAVPLLFRGSERILIVAAATICILLGYKLFKIVSQQESEGKFKLGNLSVTLTKVGPGVFFSLFGAYVLFHSVTHPLIMTLPQNNSKPTTEQSAVKIPTNINWMATTDPISPDLAQRAIGPIKILNCLAGKADGSKLVMNRVEAAIHTAKVAIIADVWQKEWGDSDDFIQLNMGNVDKESPIGKIYFAEDGGC
ncbi:MAG: hypothetical protein QNK40_07010 [Desulfobacterales bacterium]|nr:hypothetical protein [Desulfobacterales bacterium]